jgi:hypothetical protein
MSEAEFLFITPHLLFLLDQQPQMKAHGRTVDPAQDSIIDDLRTGISELVGERPRA